MRGGRVEAVRTTALGIPCPWSGDEFEKVPATYAAWFWLYKHSRIWRHRIGLHDWRYTPALHARKCSWCGRRTA